MRRSTCVVAAYAILASVVQHDVKAAEKPSDLIVGTWRTRNEITNPMPNDSTFEFALDGTGEVYKTEKGKRVGAKTKYKITKEFGNACIVVVDYVGAPGDVKPLTMLVAFDGPDALVTEAGKSGIRFFDRQK